MRFGGVPAIVFCALCACSGGRTPLFLGPEQRAQSDGGGIAVDGDDTRDAAAATDPPPPEDASRLDGGNATDAHVVEVPTDCTSLCGNPPNVIVTACGDGVDCEYACSDGFADCNGQLVKDGCEVNSNLDAQHCGFCDNACPKDLVCSYGLCQQRRALRAIAVGGNTSCALRHDGELSCWGDNSSGQLGIGDTVTDSFAEPHVVNASLRFTQVSVGQNHACGLAMADDGENDVADGGLYCWGRGGEKLGDRGRETCADGFECASAPREIAIGRGVSRVAAGGTFTCGISRSSDRVVVCWGDNDHGQLGRGYLGPDASIAARVLTADGTPLFGVLDIAVGRAHACARLATGVACWGDNSGAQLGDAYFGDALMPNVQVCDATCSSHAVLIHAFEGVRVLEIDATGDFTCALSVRGDGNHVECWGANQRGQLGRMTSSYGEAGPEPVAFLDEAGEPTAIGVGGEFACAAINDDPYLDQCWGDNTLGQLGYQTNVDFSATPLPIQAQSSMPPRSVHLDLGLSHACAQAAGDLDPLMRCWGRSTEGQVGGGYDQSVTVPRTVTLCEPCECETCEMD